MSSNASENQKKAMRAERFGNSSFQRAKKSNRDDWRKPKVQNFDQDEFERQLVGTCEQLEKCYLRLTGPANESEVRPKHVLIKSLARVNEVWAATSDYNRCSELLKSIRQDLTVQGIRDELAVDVYETHARLALRAQDAAEFNVCQSRLKVLYNGSPGKHWPHKDEFTACRLLYFLYTKEIADLTLVVSEVLASQSPLPSCLLHAINVVKSWLLGCHHSLFKLYVSAPPLSTMTMDLFIDRERKFYFGVLLKAYRPVVPLSLMMSELELNEPEARKFLKENGNIFFTDANKTAIDCRVTLEKNDFKKYSPK